MITKAKKKTEGKKTFSELLDHLSEYLATRKGLIPMLGMVLVFINLLVQFIFPESRVASINLFLHLGLLISVFGLMLAWAL